MQRSVELAEEHRLLRDRHADLLGMMAILQTHTNNLFRTRHYRPKLDGRFIEEGTLRRARLQRFIHQGIEAWTVLILEQIIHSRWRVHLQQPRSLGDIQNALTGLNSQPV